MQLLDASETLQRFQYLRPGVGSLPGAEASLLELKGTVQMQFNGNGYYVPLAVYLRNDHPGSPPVCIIQVYTLSARVSAHVSVYAHSKRR